MGQGTKRHHPHDDAADLPNSGPSRNWFVSGIHDCLNHHRGWSGGCHAVPTALPVLEWLPILQDGLCFGDGVDTVLSDFRSDNDPTLAVKTVGAL